MATGSRILESLGAYIKAQFQNAIIVIVLYIAGFAITGVPWWLLTGFVCGVVNLIPHLGPIITLFLAVLLKWFVTDDWVQIAYVAGVWLLIQIVDGFILSPRAAGRAGVNPFLSILITLAAGFLFGPIGMILAVPVVAVVLVILRATRRESPSR
jgi:predicted PurR-regulated permease PerM